MRKLILLACVLAIGCSGEKAPKTQGKLDTTKVYEVVELAEPGITVDGRLEEKAWEKARVMRDFCFPWREREVPPTEFRALCDRENLYFIFRVEDDDVVVDDKTQGEKALIGEDRVEFYFAPDLELKKYYSFEMDHQGRKLDYLASFHRQFDFAWDFPHLTLAGSRTPEGYIVEGSLPMKALSDLGLPSLDSGRLRVGVFRAEFSHGDGPEPVENWISWVDPQTEEEDFHIPATLGIFRKASGPGKR